MAATPTKRELLIVCVLLVSLLYLFSPTTPQGLSRPSPANVSFPDSSVVQPSPPRIYQTALSWNSGPVPQTKILAHVPGWTLFDRLYMLDGVIYVVTNEPEKAPNTTLMFSNGIFILPGPEAIIERFPTEKDIRIIGTKEAKTLFGSGAVIVDGVTWLCNDPPQFITHYYHWAAELWYGFWRTYSSLDPAISENGTTILPPPRRLIMSRLDAFHWRDYAKMNQWAVRSAFPGIQMEFKDDWRDRAEMSKVWVFDRILVADRSAAMIAWNFARFQRTAAAPFGLPGSMYWWLTLRNKVVELAGIDAEEYVSTLSNHQILDIASDVAIPGAPVITYISRQKWGRRMLIPADHERLVAELYKLREIYGYEVNVVDAENLSRVEQIRLAARTTIMMGVHGNGLTALLWMKPTARTTVMEFFFPGGFAHDYEYTARAMGITHYGFWGSQYFTSPGLPVQSYPEGFQGNEIPIDGVVVANLIVHRLSLKRRGRRLKSRSSISPSR
ncbi:hypothetical protein C8J56DRAFT_813276 [Mycena floridula]|nr:hypothetical protein C8J56DRAFT_813276 [Mycena floridula]